MEGNPPTTQELLEQLDDIAASRLDATQQSQDTPLHDVINGLSAKHLDQWIAKTAREFELDGDGLGLMLVAQLALLHNKICRLMDRHEVSESPSLLGPWSNAVSKVMGDFRRGYGSSEKICNTTTEEDATNQ